jgi:phospholipid/cholesterol/gamma-HCH transport system substrate-binding protein
VKRKRNLARLVHNYGGTVDRLGREDDELATLVSGSSKVFTRLAREDANISQAVERLPGTLAQTEATLRRVNELGRVAGPALEALRPAVRQLDRTNDELKPLAAIGEPVLREQVRPFARAARPYLDDVRPAARNLGTASPDLRKSFLGLNRFFNMASYNPKGREKLTGNLDTDRARQEGFLFWAAWVAHNSNSLFAVSDASGPYRRAIVAASCTTYRQLLAQAGGAAPLLEQVLGVQKLLADIDLCPPS